MGKRYSLPGKITNEKLTPAILAQKAESATSKGYAKQKWVTFCETLISEGYTVMLYEARRTFSKYVTVLADDGRRFKVRFSNHKPIAEREHAGDCDFFVGITHTGTRTTDDALRAVREFMARAL